VFVCLCVFLCVCLCVCVFVCVCLCVCVCDREKSGGDVSISLVKCCWVKCGEVLQCSDVLLVLFFIVLYMVVCFVYFCLIL
jgi:hypothetical protein